MPEGGVGAGSWQERGRQRDAEVWLHFGPHAMSPFVPP